MKYIRLFENYKDIEDICWRYKIEHYTINSDQTLDVNDNVIFYQLGLWKLPLKFNRVEGIFNCSDNILRSVENFPKYIGSSLFCYKNRLSDLKNFSKYIGNSLNISDNNIYSFNDIKVVNGDIFYEDNPVESIILIFEDDPHIYLEYLELYNFQKGKMIYKTRFKEALKEFGITNIPIINNYEYV